MFPMSHRLNFLKGGGNKTGEQKHGHWCFKHSLKQGEEKLTKKGD